MGHKQPKPTIGERGNAINKVTAFMAHLEHPLKPEIEAIRTIIRSADPRIQESIKWNAPSFAINEHFATLKLRPIETVQVVFHTGAKVQPIRKILEINDPAGLLKWATTDRCVATFSDMDAITSKQSALIAIVQQWIEQM